MTEHAPALVTIDPRHAAVVSGLGLPAEEVRSFFDSAFRTLHRQLESQHLAPGGPAFAWFLSPPGDTTDVQVGHEVDLSFMPTAPVDTLQLPGGQAAQLVHEGSYDDLGQSWQRLVDWVRSQGLDAGGGMLEEYLTEPGPDVDPDTVQTRLSWFVTRQE
ncbi:GyrI-like domain-containing protein [uncultured Serinicoccus sp.]|uniref:GyrI-like domain-containing protein n=1 Tax=uncultured Serinicoccus sp. TaxID=735514 RepID=UPI0026290AAF|nr:GyrI-like domain-containing protein [uncultured Serinicoccus sp.]